MKLLRVMAVPAAALVAIAVAALPAQATHSWGGYHWSRTGQATAPLVSSLSSGWTGNLATANSDWNKSQYVESGVVAGDTTSRARRRCAMTNGQIHVCNYAYGNNGWAGLASINLSGGTHISQGSVKVNDTYESGAPAAERQGVMCQEVGHTYGLDHQDTNFNNPNLGTCMDYTNDWSTNQHPNQHDYDELALIYNHSDAAAAKAAGVSKIKTGNTVTIITWAN
ncbi:MAG: hypothetical protein HOV67_30865 [Kribbellaceae bacterium]|nr:hypothetical protein [Catenulispora sp.]NUR99647.1 hypothetical protein [Kribbellaceae bacterium]